MYEIGRRINEELVATWGNLVNRVLSMMHKTCDGAIPEPGEFQAEDQELLDAVDAFMVKSAEQFERVELRAALRTGMDAAQAANQYLNATEPWKVAKGDPERARTMLFVALSAINGARVLLSPYLPFTSAALDEVLGPVDGWTRSPLEVGRAIDKPKPLFAKIDLDELAEDAAE